MNSTLRNFALLLAVVAAPWLASPGARAAAPFIEKLDLFTVGDDPAYKVYHIPGIVVTAKGTVLAWCEARKKGGDWDDIKILLRRSTDDGKTWSAPRSIADVPGPKVKNPFALRIKNVNTNDLTYNNPVLIAAYDGTVHMVFCLEYMRCFYQRSTDDGVSWSRPVEITAAFEKFRDRMDYTGDSADGSLAAARRLQEYDWKVLATGPNHSIELNLVKLKGLNRLVVPVWLSTGTGGNAHRPSVTSTIYSDDSGKTWHSGEIAVFNTDEWINPNETVAVQLADGRVMLNVRNESKTHRRLVVTSKDGATDWSTPQFDDALLEPICMAGIVRYSFAGKGGKNRILFSNPHNLERADGKAEPGKNRDRKNVSVKTSYDEGQTWAANKTIEAGWSAYSDLAVTKAGTILCFYGRADKPNFAGDALRLARFNLEWLTDGKDSSGPSRVEVKPPSRAPNDPGAAKAWLAHGLTEAQREGLREAFRWGIEQQFIPGGALLVMHRGETVFREGFGVADLETKQPFTVDAPCRIASVTKPHTATLLALLVSQGKLSWDDPVDKHLPQFAKLAVRGKGSAARPPKIRELLSHTAGFPGNDERRAGEPGFKTDGTLAQAVDDLARAGLVTEPGTVFAYTGLGYMVAGRVAEVVSGQEFGALMSGHLLKPVGAATAVFHSAAPDELIARMPAMYERAGGKLVKADLTARGDARARFPTPGGGLISTLDDVARVFLLHRDAGVVAGKKLCAPEALQAQYRAQPATGRNGYGLGFNVMRAGAQGGEDRIRHIGASGTLALIDFKQDLIVVLLTQVPAKQTQPFTDRVMKAVNAAFPPQ